MAYEARVLADSVSPLGHRLTTVLVTFPRFILAEVNTHKMVSKSSASSRAVPVEKRIAMALSDPFIPESFGRNRAGMQSSEELAGAEAAEARAVWTEALNAAVRHAHELKELGVHKQYANRLLEPFLWHTAVLTATDWSNMRALRTGPDAQPEFRRAAELLFGAMDASRLDVVREGEWHLPFVAGSPDEREVREEARLAVARGADPTFLPQVSCARAARVSYLLHDGSRSVEKDVERARQLREQGHMAPFEHAARPMTTRELAHHRRVEQLVEDRETGERFRFVRAGTLADDRYVVLDERVTYYCGNLNGWVALRKLLPCEEDFGRYQNRPVAAEPSLVGGGT